MKYSKREYDKVLDGDHLKTLFSRYRFARINWRVRNRVPTVDGDTIVVVDDIIQRDDWTLAEFYTEPLLRLWIKTYDWDRIVTVKELDGLLLEKEVRDLV
jgi:hypothetical protein